MDDHVLAVIPARSGSKGLPDKNVKKLLDKPLLAWSVEQAKTCDRIDRIVLSTDSEEYAETGEEYGADVPFIRPDELALDDTPIGAVIAHLIEELEGRGEVYDQILMLEPTSPLRRPSDIDDALDSFYSAEVDATSLVSVREIEEEGHPYFVKELKDGALSPFIETEEEYYQRQQLPTLYQPEGTLYLSDTQTFKAAQSFYQDRTMPHVVQPWQKYEIDDLHDFICVEAILEHNGTEVAAY